jgi:hypothetical protein
MITKSERTELRSIVKQQFKVLRAELAQRQLEMYAEVEDEITARYSDDDATWSGLMHEVHEATMEANRRINDALYNAGYQKKSGTERMWINTPRIDQPTEDRHQLRRTAKTRIDAQVKAAGLRLDREEADLLRTLGIGVIESEEARLFLQRIPTVGELVSSARLAELERAMGDES